MGNVAGKYNAKETGFVPGASSLHNSMTPHGPESDAFIKASTCELKPTFVSPNGLAFMFETCFMLKLTKYASDNEHIDVDYYKSWEGLQNNFTKQI